MHETQRKLHCHFWLDMARPAQLHANLPILDSYCVPSKWKLISKETEVLSSQFNTQSFNLQAKMESHVIRLQDSLIVDTRRNSHSVSQIFCREIGPNKRKRVRYTTTFSWTWLVLNLMRPARGLFGSFVVYNQMEYTSKWKISTSIIYFYPSRATSKFFETS